LFSLITGPRERLSGANARYGSMSEDSCLFRRRKELRACLLGTDPSSDCPAASATRLDETRTAPVRPKIGQADHRIERSRDGPIPPNSETHFDWTAPFVRHDVSSLEDPLLMATALPAV
jgi:hypothetical protein